METESSSIQVFGEYLNNLRAVNLYISVDNYDEARPLDPLNLNPLKPSNLPLLSVQSNVIYIEKLGSFTIVLSELCLEDCSNIPPRTLEKNILCYRLVVKPSSGYGSVAAEVVSNFEKTVDEGAKNLVKNSINTVALKEGSVYQVRCRFCASYLSDFIAFDRIRPLPSKNWVENAHELWYCHPPEVSHSHEPFQQDMTSRLNKINLVVGGGGGEEEEASKSKSIVELLKSPDTNYCFYGPCNWALNRSVLKGIKRNDSFSVSRADCGKCASELGSFTSDSCVKVWDYGVEWVEKGKESESVEDGGNLGDILNMDGPRLRASQNFKSIVFATIYELSDHPTFRFTVSSTIKGNSVFLWNIDRNLTVYQTQNQRLALAIPPSSNSNSLLEFKLNPQKVAKFFFAIKENDELPISDPREVLIIQESEQNEQSILTVPDFVYKAGVQKLKETSGLYSRNEQTLQCGYLVYDE